MDRRLFNNPIHSDQIDSILGCLDLTSGSLVLDVGCGKAEMLARLAERHGCEVVGVDPDELVVGVARSRLAFLAERARVHACRFDDLNFSSETFDAALCVGALHAFGAPREAFDRMLTTFKDLVRPGGAIVVGDGYWRQPPSEEYLRATGMQATDHGPLGESIRIAESRGWIPVYATTAARHDWDHFESLTWMKAEDEFRDHPSDATRQRVLHWRAWRENYFRWGRDTLGFGIYLLRKPTSLGPG